MKVPFSKYSGCGNDFILFDNRNLVFPDEKKSSIQQICHRQKGIGADGLILWEHSTTADYKMRIFNADGSEAEMCGNGIRCLLKFMLQKGLREKQYTIETIGQICSVEPEKENVLVEMPLPKDLHWDKFLHLNNESYQIHYLNVGVPHVILFVDEEEDLATIDLTTLGPAIRYHPDFAPKGTNVNIVKMLKSQYLAIRTYERGVEQETLACGTGASASAIAAAYKLNMPSPITLLTSSKEELVVDFANNDDKYTNVKLKGPARLVFTGIIEL